MKEDAGLQQSKEDMIRSERLAFTGRIAANIAHEIRNPLANVMMAIQAFKKTFRPKKSQRKHIEIITKNVERINFLITELLNCARPPKLDMQPHDIHKILEDALDSARGKIDSQKIKVIKQFITTPSTVNVDKEHAQRAFTNLVTNGIEAMPKGGKLTITTERGEGSFVVKIQDTGKGIPAENIMKIYDPFFSSKPGGIGLGLTICYGIIVSHGGIIEVESKPKNGSVFMVSLPV